jgi:hypothetical protein
MAMAMAMAMGCCSWSIFCHIEFVHQRKAAAAPERVASIVEVACASCDYTAVLSVDFLSGSGLVATPTCLT